MAFSISTGECGRVERVYSTHDFYAILYTVLCFVSCAPWHGFAVRCFLFFVHHPSFAATPPIQHLQYLRLHNPCLGAHFLEMLKNYIYTLREINNPFESVHSPQELSNSPNT